MKKGVLRKIKTAICMTLAVTCLSGIPVFEVEAAENVIANDEIEEMETYVGDVPEGYFGNLHNARASLTECRIAIDFGSSGMGITIFTGTTDISPVVGVKDIKVEQKVWYGWKEVAYADGAEVADTDSMAVSMTFTGAIKGETYRVTCTHYADLTYDGVENYTEGDSNTGAFVFTY